MIHAALRVESTALIETNIAERVGVNGPFISDRQAPLPYADDLAVGQRPTSLQCRDNFLAGGCH
jgi:hypothetical protein